MWRPGWTPKRTGVDTSEDKSQECDLFLFYNTNFSTLVVHVSYSDLRKDLIRL